MAAAFANMIMERCSLNAKTGQVAWFMKHLPQCMQAYFFSLAQVDLHSVVKSNTARHITASMHPIVKSNTCTCYDRYLISCYNDCLRLTYTSCKCGRNESKLFMQCRLCGQVVIWYATFVWVLMGSHESDYCSGTDSGVASFHQILCFVRTVACISMISFEHDKYLLFTIFNIHDPILKAKSASFDECADTVAFCLAQESGKRKCPT